jgi:nucleoid-associated protein YgaU
MPKDLKIGMIAGLVIVTAAMLWLFVGPGINIKEKNLSIRSTPQTTTLSETLETPDSRKKPELEVIQEYNPLPSNDEQIEEPEEEPEPVNTDNSQPEKVKSQRFHIIRSGETLSEIARHYYGSATKWRKILNANKHLIQDVNRLKPGTKIIVPE